MYDPHDPGWKVTTDNSLDDIENEVVTIVRRRDHPGEFVVVATAQENIPAGSHVVIDPRTGMARLKRQP